MPPNTAVPSECLLFATVTAETCALVESSSLPQESKVIKQIDIRSKSRPLCLNNEEFLFIVSPSDTLRAADSSLIIY